MVTEALLLGFFIFLLFLVLRRPPGLPPGIWGLPVVGWLPSTSVCLSDQVMKLRKVYGDIIMWRIGSVTNVFLCNYDIIKTALKRLDLSNRPNIFTFSLFSQGSSIGLIFCSGLQWQRNRRFTLRQLRDLGMGKTELEEAVQEEGRQLVQDFKKHTGKDQPLPLSIGVAVLNVIWTLVADTRHELDDPKAQDFIRLIDTTNGHLQGPVLLFNIFPWLQTLAPKFLKKRLGYYAIKNDMKSIQDTMREFIKQHKATLDPSHPRDLVDNYLIELQQQSKDSPQDGNLSEEDLTAVMTDLFSAGIDTTTSTLRWSIKYLVKYPQVQARLQRDIDAVVPKGGFLYYHERSKLPYLEAFIHEVHRCVSLAPMAVAHSASQDTQIEGYTIPKGTVVFSHLECCHKDPKYWAQPHQFHPDHFINADGSFNAKKEGFVPFGIGRRSCPGESLARVEIFVFLTGLLQNFSFAPPPGYELIMDKNPTIFVLNTPKPYRVIITERM